MVMEGSGLTTMVSAWLRAVGPPSMGRRSNSRVVVPPVCFGLPGRCQVPALMEAWIARSGSSKGCVQAVACAVAV